MAKGAHFSDLARHTLTCYVARQLIIFLVQVLYRRQSLPDDHTDKSFLDELVLNFNVRKRTYWPVSVHIECIFALMSRENVTRFVRHVLQYL